MILSETKMPAHHTFPNLCISLSTTSSEPIGSWSGSVGVLHKSVFHDVFKGDLETYMHVSRTRLMPMDMLSFNLIMTFEWMTIYVFILLILCWLFRLKTMTFSLVFLCIYTLKKSHLIFLVKKGKEVIEKNTIYNIQINLKYFY